jgi:hypothetical protein
MAGGAVGFHRSSESQRGKAAPKIAPARASDRPVTGGKTGRAVSTSPVASHVLLNLLDVDSCG